MLGASRWRAFREVTWPLLRPAVALGRVDRVPVHVHLVRRGPAPGRAGVRDARGGDLPPDGRAARPAGRGRAGAPADRLSWLLLLVVYARAARSAAPSRQRLRPRRESPRGRRGRAASGRSSAASSAAWRVLLGLPLAVLVERSLAGPERLRPRQLRGAVRPSSARGALFVPPIEAIAQLARLRRRGHGSSPAARPARGAGHRATGAAALRAALRRAADAAARARRRSSSASASSSRSDQPPLDLRTSVAAHPDRPRARRAAVRRARGGAGHALDRPRGCARRPRSWAPRPRGRGARSTLPIVGAGRAGRGRLRLRRVAGRVRGDAVHRPARHADDARSPSTACSASRARSHFGQAMAMATVLMVADRRAPCCVIERLRAAREPRPF